MKTIVEWDGAFWYCPVDQPAIISMGQTFVIGAGLVLGLIALLLYRWRTRNDKYEVDEEQP